MSAEFPIERHGSTVDNVEGTREVEAVERVEVGAREGDVEADAWVDGSEGRGADGWSRGLAGKGLSKGPVGNEDVNASGGGLIAEAEEKGKEAADTTSSRRGRLRGEWVLMVVDGD